MTTMHISTIIKPYPLEIYGQGGGALLPPGGALLTCATCANLKPRSTGGALEPFANGFGIRAYRRVGMYARTR